MHGKRLTLFLESFAFCCACAAQSISLTPGISFTATRTLRSTHDGKVTTVSETIARRNDGSTYVSYPIEQSGGIAVIQNTARHQAITLNVASHTYTVSSDPTIRPRPLSADNTARYDRLESPWVKHLEGNCELKTLGKGKVEGLESIGSLESCPDGHTMERWYSPVLNLDIEIKTQTSSDSTNEIEVENIHLGEPAPSLFEIPAGYTEELPRTNPQK
jgi:hypothetical protein